MYNAQCKIKNRLIQLWIVHCALVIGACSVPNLEKPECTQARDTVKQFYSFHFGNDMALTVENLKARERFLTSDLFKSLSASAGSEDYFTKSAAPAKTFKIAKCDAPQPDKADIRVQLYWRDDAKTVQKEVNVETVRQNDTWLINKVSN